MDQIFYIRQILEKKWGYNGTVHHIFIDFKKAYASVKREVLYNILLEFGVHKKLVRLIKMYLNETYSKVSVGKVLSDEFPIQNGLKQGDDLSPLIFSFALEYAIWKVLEDQVGLELNGTHQLLVYVDDDNTNKNDIHDEIKSTLNSGNACYYSVQHLLSSRIMSKNLKIKIYKTVILPVVLYGCETWSLTLREERRLRVFENRVLRKIFGPRREEDGSWRKLRNDELHNLYSSPNIVRMIKSRRMRWAGHVARMGVGRGVYRVLVGGPKVRDHWEDLGVGERITLRRTLVRWDRWDELDLAGSR
jgi:hypothetical protein